MWNVSPSVPVGLYSVSNARPSVGEIAVVRLPFDVAIVAHRRGYIPRANLLLKPTAATAGARVCRIADRVFIDGILRATAMTHDRKHRAMPAWHGCTTLAQNQLFVLSATPGSFDSRYFGVLDANALIGRAHPLWTN